MQKALLLVIAPNQADDLFHLTNYKPVKTIGLSEPSPSQGKINTVLSTTLLMDNPAATSQLCSSLLVSPPQHLYCSTEAEIGRNRPQITSKASVGTLGVRWTQLFRAATPRGFLMDLSWHNYTVYTKHG